MHLHRVRRHALRDEIVARLDGELLRRVVEPARIVELRLDGLLAHRHLVGEAHAVGGKHAGEADG